MTISNKKKRQQQEQKVEPDPDPDRELLEKILSGPKWTERSPDAVATVSEAIKAQRLAGRA